VPIIKTDYLVVGAGAAGLAFADSLVTHSSAEVVMVDRRHRPGGHWNDAYPFVRLHQPSAFYGVTSRVLGTDSIDRRGPNAGLYERATGAEVSAYFEQVTGDLEASGRVRFFGLSDYRGSEDGKHRFVSRLTGQSTTVQVRRKLVDATYLETPVPATHTPPFDVEPGVHLVPVGDLVELAEPAAGFTVLGGGKTGMDACAWLLDQGVDPDRIRWIRPRDAWLLDREYQQTLELVTGLFEGVSLYVEAAALAESVEDLFRRLEACGQMVRIDPEVEPTMYHCATVSVGELEQLRSVERVVRLGRVRHVGADHLVLEEGEIPTDRGEVHVDCTAAGLRLSPARTVFEPDRITIQQVRTCQPTFNAALIGFVEASFEDLGAKNRLCPPNPYPDRATDWLWATAIAQRAQAAWGAEPELNRWIERSRLNATRGLREQLGDPRVQAALTRYADHLEAAIANLECLVEANALDRRGVRTP
jgi:hypothetical protein